MSNGTPPSRAILLSAGRGSRLGDLTRDRPKCLLEFGGRPLIDWQIDTLLHSGIDDIVVIVGFGAARVIRHLADRPNVRTFYNPFFHVADNLASLWLAREMMDRDFLILNGDTLVSPEIVDAVLKTDTAPISVTVSRKPAYDDDDMKVALRGDRVMAVGKKLLPEETDAESIGLLAFRRGGVTMFRQAVERALCDPSGISNWYLSVVDMLAKLSHVAPVFVDGDGAAEVDYPADLPIAEALVAKWRDQAIDPVTGSVWSKYFAEQSAG